MMNFQAGANVFTAQGDKVGTLKSVVLNPTDQQVNGLIVERGFLFTEDKVLPLNWVAHTQQNGDIVLYEGTHDFDRLPVFEETFYVDADRPLSEHDTRIPGEIPIPPAYYYFGAPGYYPVTPLYDANADQREVTVQNIPDEAVALKIGAGVFAVDHEQVGSVEQLFTRANGDQITHLLIAKGLFMQHRKLVPTAWISTITDEGVYLTVHKDVIDRLPDYDTHNWEHRVRNMM